MQHDLHTRIGIEAETAPLRRAAVGGVVLDPPIRYRLEHSFGIDLSDIRIHADPVVDR
jgi:hypothetical protein